jgi:hypothetical protein
LSRVLLCAAAALVLSLSPALGQGGAYTPAAGSKERQAIVEALRAPVQRQLRRKVVFKIEHLRAQGGWAFLKGVPQQPGGAAMDYRGTPYQEAIEAGAFDDGIVALLRKRGARWQVVEYVLGATDVPYVDWDTKHGAPSSIFDGR